MRTTIRTFAFLFGPLVLMGPPAFAQDEYPRLEVFGGASYLLENGRSFPPTNSFGFRTSVSGNVNRSFGIVGGLAGHYSANRDTRRTSASDLASSSSSAVTEPLEIDTR